MIDQDGRKLTANNQYMNKIFPFKEENRCYIRESMMLHVNKKMNEKSRS